MLAPIANKLAPEAQVVASITAAPSLSRVPTTRPCTCRGNLVNEPSQTGVTAQPEDRHLRTQPRMSNPRTVGDGARMGRVANH